jgi:hypothetical protein
VDDEAELNLEKVEEEMAADYSDEVKHHFTYSKCPNSIQLVVFCSRAISEYTCGPQRPLYHPSFYCISLSLSPPLSP